MKFLINLLNPLNKYKWTIILSLVSFLWLTSLWYVHSHDNKVCQQNKQNEINAALQTQLEDLKIADENLQKNKIQIEQVRQTDKQIITKYIERTKNEKSAVCDGNFTISESNIGLYNQIGTTSTNSPK